MTNGILYIVDNSTDLNESGDPVQNPSILEGGIPSLIKNTGYQNRGVFREGQLPVPSYNILIDLQPFEAKRVSIERDGIKLGEFTVQSIEVLNLVGKIKIIV